MFPSEKKYSRKCILYYFNMELWDIITFLWFLCMYMYDNTVFFIFDTCPEFP